jgi:hypothetical protein
MPPTPSPGASAIVRSKNGSYHAQIDLKAVSYRAQTETSRGQNQQRNETNLKKEIVICNLREHYTRATFDSLSLPFNSLRISINGRSIKI